MLNPINRQNPTIMAHDFSKVPAPDLPRSKFKRNHKYGTTMDASWLVPFHLEEIYPGDTMNLRSTIFARLATPIAPIMDNMFFDTFYFFVPSRLLWENFKKFHGEQRNPGDSTDYLIPMFTAPEGGYDEQSLMDYFGLPTKVAGFTHSALPLRAYNLIWNEWFRDQNLQDSVPVDITDAPGDLANYKLLKRGKRHDYFTSCLPWPQKGEAVTLTLFGDAPVISDGTVPTYDTGVGSNGQVGMTGGPVGTMYHGASAANTFTFNNSGLEADLSDVAAFTINAMREAFQIQRIFERDARGGTRYIEGIKSHFGVTSSDARLQRPEYLGGGSTPVNITPVPQTSSTDGTTPQGNLAAYGTALAMGHGYQRSFEEHGYVIGLMSVRADLTYQQGLDRLWSRETRFDFYLPGLAHLGEQAVLNKEIFCDGTEADDDVFGYQERFAELRYFPSRFTGRFRSNATAPLDFWHLSEEFATGPALNDEFIEDSASTVIDRVIAVPSEPQFIVDVYNDYTSARVLPVHGVPGLIDHF